MHGLETIRKINARKNEENPRVTYYDENNLLRTRVFDSEEEKAAFIRDIPSKDIVLP